MKKVAIVGVEGSGKTVMLAGLGELYLHPDKNGIFLEPKNYETAAYVADKIARMRRGHWPVATPEDVMQGLDWTIRRRTDAKTRPEPVCQLSCLDFAGEVYSAAFGISEQKDDLEDQIKTLKDYVRGADALLVLVNLKDVISGGNTDPNVQKSMWITKNILDVALDDSDGHTPPRTALVLSQADAYADTIRSCGGARETLERYLPHVGNSYNWVDVLAVSVVDKTRLDDDGCVVPAEDFSVNGVRPIVDWILGAPQTATEFDANSQSCGSEGDSCAGEEQTSAENMPRRRGKFGAFHFLILLVLGSAVGYAFRSGYDAQNLIDHLRLTQSVAVTNFVETPVPDVKSAEPEKVAEPTVPENEPVVAQDTAKNNRLIKDPDKVYKLGCSYFRGSDGRPKDDKKAVRFWRMAAEQGHELAQSTLGFCYASGRGVERDCKEAVKWFLKAAEQGDADAQNNLGVCFRDGLGVGKNNKEAMKWFEMAAKQGDEDARENLNALKTRLNIPEF